MDPSTITLESLGAMPADELREAIAAMGDRLTALHMGDDGQLRSLDRTEQGEFDRLVNLRDRADEHLRIRETYNRHPGATERAFGPTVGGRAGRVEVSDALEARGDQIRDTALRVLEARGSHLPAAQQDHLAHVVGARLSRENPNLDGDYVARRMVITSSDEYCSAFQQILTQAHPLLTEREVQAVRMFQELEARAMGEVTPSAGGLGVPVLIDPSILLSSGAEVAPLLAVARVVPVTSNVWKAVSSGPPTFTFQTEGAAVADSSPTLAQPSITVHMARAMLPYSIEVSQDYPNFAAEMEQLLSQGWTDLVATKTITGSGTGEPKGILTALDGTAASEIVLATNSAAGGFNAAAIFAGWNAVPERFRTRARWLHSVSVESQIRSFATTTTGQASSYFTVDLTADGLSRINGRPVTITDSMPTYASTTGHANFAIVGDLNNYVIAMRQGLAVERVPLLFSSSSPGLPTGQRGFFAWGRFGADVTVANGLRLINQT